MKVQMCIIIDEGEYAGDYRKTIEMPFPPFIGLNMILGDYIYCTVSMILWCEGENDGHLEAHLRAGDGEGDKWKSGEINGIADDPAWTEL